MRTMGQKRAEYALNSVISCNCKDKFKPFSAGAPSMILKNGLGQTFAFWKSKGKEEHNLMLKIIRKWIVEECKYAEGDNDTSFIKFLASEPCGQSGYLKVQQETLKLLEWVKRFANADLGGN